MLTPHDAVSLCVLWSGWVRRIQHAVVQVHWPAEKSAGRRVLERYQNIKITSALAQSRVLKVPPGQGVTDPDFKHEQHTATLCSSQSRQATEEDVGRQEEKRRVAMQRHSPTMARLLCLEGCTQMKTDKKTN